MINPELPRTCYLKNIADKTVTLRKSKVRRYSDISDSRIPYIVCRIPDLHSMPMKIDEESFRVQMRPYQVPGSTEMTTTRNQHCTWGAFITTFHRDTMFSRKVHTLSPGSLKLWCFEREVGQLNLLHEDTAHNQMLTVTTNPEKFDFCMQEPGQVVEHDGAFAHFVITFNHNDSCYDQWSALIGWEINTSRRIDQSKRVDIPLLQGKGGHLVQVTGPVYLKACAAKSSISYTLLKAQGTAHTTFMELQKKKAMRKVELIANNKKANQKRFAGLLSRSKPRGAKLTHKKTVL